MNLPSGTLDGQTGYQLRKLAYKMIHSTTLVLPAWQNILRELDLTISLMPWDISTRWDSTFDMLAYALKYQKAIESVMQQRDLGLHQFELTEIEWELVDELQGVLKVSAGLQCGNQ